MTKIFFIFVMTAVSSVAFGQGHHPYAGLEQRTVKALSEQQIADLRAGRGMGLALPAELNGYPGPSHVLENADALGLSAEQREHTKGLFEAMKAEAVPVGERLIEQEAKLDRLFADREDHAREPQRGDGRDWNDTSAPSPNSLEIPFDDDGRAVARPSRALPRTKGIWDESRSIASPAFTALMSR